MGESKPDTGTSSLDALRNGGSTAASGPLKDVFFAFDRAELSEEARAVLKENTGWLKAHGSVRIQIEGHCDERGAEDYNMALGAKRAQAAVDYITALGIPASRMSTISYGEEVPACKEHSEECWSKNRRARFVVLSGGPAS
jgi:peptidoglycan-associated lipoprotein